MTNVQPGFWPAFKGFIRCSQRLKIAEAAPFNDNLEPVSELVQSLQQPPPYASAVSEAYMPDVWECIERTVNTFGAELRELSLKIHGHPETAFKEVYAHDTLTDFMSSHGFSVTSHYKLPTGWRAEFTLGSGGRVLGINSEMDALPGIGHACGHNLIAVAGVGVALAAKAAMEKHNLRGTVVLLGTPAEESGGGKAILIERGAYDEMDVCIMCHPGPGLQQSTTLVSTLAMQAIQVEFLGHTAHAAAAPWEGQNALDAAFMAYSAISVLRQQIKPTHRVHGIVEGRNWAPNIIPDYAKMRWFIRAPTRTELDVLRDRVQACFEAAALATSCKVEISFERALDELSHNPVLGEDFGRAATRAGLRFVAQGTGASTDFGNVTYALPAIHPGYAIPTKPNGGNHTPSFTEAAATQEAHKMTMAVAKALALTGVRVLHDEMFFKEVRESFEKSKRAIK